jgi:hypothetical protein
METLNKIVRNATAKHAPVFINELMKVNDLMYKFVEENPDDNRLFKFEGKIIKTLIFHAFKQESLEDEIDDNDPYSGIWLHAPLLIPLRAYVGFDIAEYFDDLSIKINKNVIKSLRTAFKRISLKTNKININLGRAYTLVSSSGSTKRYTAKILKNISLKSSKVNANQKDILYNVINPLEGAEQYLTDPYLNCNDLQTTNYCIPEIFGKFYFLQQFSELSISNNNVNMICDDEREFSTQEYFSSFLRNNPNPR